MGVDVEAGEPECISIHALHEESDHCLASNGLRICGFQSTLSMRRAIRVSG